MSPFRTSLLLSGATAAALGLSAPAAAQSWVPAKPFPRTSPYVAGDMHNHTTCTDGSVSTGYLVDRSVGTGAPGGVPNFGLDWFIHGNHGGSGANDCRFSSTGANTGIAGDVSTTWLQTLGQTIQGITINSLEGARPTPNNGTMYRWQSIRDVEYPIMIQKSQQYKKVVIEGLETNAPGHEHVDTAILNGQFPASGPGNALRQAEFEYRFDRNDSDTLGLVNGAGTQVWTGKNPNNSGTAGHAKSVEAVAWLQANGPVTSYYVPTHTERAGAFNPTGSNGYNIEHVRDFNNAGPTVAFGIESPGHYPSPDHSYGAGAIGGGTFGGAGIYTSKIGGLWDGMLGEGRNTFVYISSDWHNRGMFGARDRFSTGDFMPGEQTKLYVPNQIAFRAQSVVDGMRSGNSFSVNSDMVTSDFTFRATVNGITKGMGQTLEANPGDTITIEMRVVIPAAVNFSPYSFPNPILQQVGITQPINKPVLDHVDLITGNITGVVAPGAPGYAVVNTAATVYNPSTVIAQTFDSNNWTVTPQANGTTRVEFTTTLTMPAGPFYVRARGTNIPRSTPFATDSAGNPLTDTGITNIICGDAACPAHMPTRTDANSVTTKRVDTDVEAWSNNWLYANPIFFRPTGSAKLLVETNADLAASFLAQPGLAAK